MGQNLLGQNRPKICANRQIVVGETSGSWAKTSWAKINQNLRKWVQNPREVVQNPGNFEVARKSTKISGSGPKSSGMEQNLLGPNRPKTPILGPFPKVLVDFGPGGFGPFFGRSPDYNLPIATDFWATLVQEVTKRRGQKTRSKDMTKRHDQKACPKEMSKRHDQKT